MRFINGFQVDAHGTSIPGAYQLTPEQVAEVQLREMRQQISSISAAADEAQVTGQIRAAGTYDIDAFDRVAHARGWSPRQSIAAKLHIAKTGATFDQARQLLRLP